MNANDIEWAGANMNETVRRLQHTIDELTNGVVLWNQQDRVRLQLEIDQLQHRLAQAEQDVKRLDFVLKDPYGFSQYTRQAIDSAMKETKP
jgi:flagellar assembly factor FliW